MKRILNTLFITTQETYINKENEALVVQSPEGKKTMIPFITLEGIVCFGNIRPSPFLLGACAEKNIQVSFVTEYGKFLWRVQGKVHGNVLLRKEQYRISDDEVISADIARNFLIGKLHNSRVVLERFTRDHPEISPQEFEKASRTFFANIKKIKKDHDLDTLRGIEGDSAAAYFNRFDDMIIAQKDDFIFTDRNRRPPLDKVNALLSFLYTMLYHDACTALEVVGLDPAVGFLHRDRPGRMSLALDLVEEFRPFLADRLVLSLINRKELTAGDFDSQGSGAVLLTDEGRKKVLVAYQERKHDSITHPFLDDKMYIGMLFHAQAMLLARYIRKDIDQYPPFLWR